jgi:hypothetical protein
MDSIFRTFTTALEKTYPAPRKISGNLRVGLKLAPEMVMLNKNHHMIAYGIISWKHREESPFSERKLPAITQLYVKPGYINKEDFEKLIRKVELALITKGHLNFGLEIQNDEFLDQKALDYLNELGYSKELFSTEHKTIFLEKRIELLK